MSVAIDLCIRHGLVAQLEALLFPPPSEGSAAEGEAARDDEAVALLEEVSYAGVAKLVCFLRIIRMIPMANQINARAGGPLGGDGPAGPAQRGQGFGRGGNSGAFKWCDGLVGLVGSCPNLKHDSHTHNNNNQNGGASLPATVPTLRRVALFLAGHQRCVVCMKA